MYKTEKNLSETLVLENKQKVIITIETMKLFGTISHEEAESIRNASFKFKEN